MGENPHMNISKLLPGDKVRTIDGNVVEILTASEDGQWCSYAAWTN